jgi:hypothetical protein
MIDPDEELRQERKAMIRFLYIVTAFVAGALLATWVHG